MKIQLDTDKKTIEIEDEVKLSSLFETLEKLLPGEEWKSFTLETNTSIHQWSNPIVIRERTYPTYPWWGSAVYCSTNAVQNFKTPNVNLPALIEGTYNIEA